MRAELGAGAGMLAFLATSGLFLGCAASRATPDLSPLRAGEAGCAIRCARVLTVDGEDRAYSPALILVREGRIAYVGPDRPVPAGYEVTDFGSAWAAPGMVELHSHIHGGGFGDINDMVFPTNPELRASSTLRPSNAEIRRACAGGVTTLYGIPGSGTVMGGFGVVYKSKTSATFEECVVRDPGGMKIAQSYNPERRAGDLGLTRAGLAWILEDLNDRAAALQRAGESPLELENLERVHARELPVLIHCAGSDGFPAAARMWQVRYGTRCVLSHGCFDAHATAPWIVATGAPVNAGPREIDFTTTRDGAITGTAARYLAAGAKDLSLNTDSPVVPQEELFLQGAVAARYGADDYEMLRAVTIHPARVFGLDDRVGSLEVGKDADIVLRTGDPLDPRSRVECVFIDGAVQYDRRHDGQWF